MPVDFLQFGGGDVPVNTFFNNVFQNGCFFALASRGGLGAAISKNELLWHVKPMCACFVHVQRNCEHARSWKNMGVSDMCIYIYI